MLSDSQRSQGSTVMWQGHALPAAVATARVVLAEGDDGLRRVLASRLAAEGYDVRVVERAEELRAQRGDFDVDLIVASMSDSGSAVHSVREQSDVLLLAVLPCETGKADALEVVDAGADDVLVKPFEPRELITKARALLRRHTVAARPADVLHFDGLHIDMRTREVTVGGETVELPAREFDLLVFLASSPRTVFSRTQIMAAVWAIDDGLGTATVTEHVRRLRSRIEPNPSQPRWIQTVWSVGYRFSP